MVTNGEGWHYLAVTKEKFPALLRGITELPSFFGSKKAGLTYKSM